MSKGALVDLTRCTGCRACQVACKAWNDNPGELTVCAGCYDNPPELSAETWTRISFTEVEEGDKLDWIFTKRQCMHCAEPACVSACPVHALHETESGAVIYEADKCIGCRYCMVACPFGIPKIDWYKTLPVITKCTFCFDRQGSDAIPACIKSCPTGALTFGERDELIAEAKGRIQQRPDAYVDHIYGEHEVGGTQWMYLSSVAFDKLGFPTYGSEPVTELSEQVSGVGLPVAGAGVAVVLGGIYWFSKRRERLMAAKGKAKAEKEA
jgi:formate dehydrogenase iron-sulfur subunit